MNDESAAADMETLEDVRIDQSIRRIRVLREALSFLTLPALVQA